MFEHLPVVSEETADACSQEVMLIVDDLNVWMTTLMQENKYLAAAIVTCAEVVALPLNEDAKEQARGDAVVAQLAVLRLISYELNKAKENKTDTES